MARLRPEDLLPSEEELRLMREAQSAGGTGQAVGSTLGSLAGGGLSFLAGPGAPALAPALMSAGGALGGLAGGMIGGGMSEAAQKRLAELEAARQEKIDAYQMREEALRRLLEQT